MGYTLEIGSYVFDGSTHIQPSLERSWDYVYNYNVEPAVIAEEAEIWTLKGFVYRTSDPTTTNTDIAALRAILNNKSSQVSSVLLKLNGSTVASLSSSDFDQIMVRGMKSHAGPGALVNHWTGDLVIVGRNLLGDNSGIVFLNKEITDTYNTFGLRKQTLTGQIHVTPGTDVTVLVQTYGLTSLGNNFVFTTGGPGNVDIKITNPPSNTKADFRCEQVERGENLPSGALDWQHSTTTVDTAQGRVVRGEAQAGSSVLSSALSAARSIKPGTGVKVTEERQDATALTVGVSYQTLAPRPAQAAFYGGTGKMNTLERTVTIEGGGPPSVFTRINGYDPFTTIGASEPITVRERIRARWVGDLDIKDTALPAPLLPVAYMQPSSSSGPAYRIDKAEQSGADEYGRDAVRIYQLPNASAIDFTDLFNKLKNKPVYATQEDLTARLGVANQ